VSETLKNDISTTGVASPDSALRVFGDDGERMVTVPPYHVKFGMARTRLLIDLCQACEGPGAMLSEGGDVDAEALRDGDE